MLMGEAVLGMLDRSRRNRSPTTTTTTTVTQYSHRDLADPLPILWREALAVYPVPSDSPSLQMSSSEACEGIQ